MAKHTPVTVVALRHADVDLSPPDPDPSLNAAGRARSRALAHVLRDLPVTAVLVSGLRRTAETAAPFLAERPGLQAVVADTPVDRAAEIRSGSLGGCVVIVGHSNTVPDLVAALGSGSAPVIAPTEFDHLFLVTVDETGGSPVPLRYGAGSASP